MNNNIAEHKTMRADFLNDFSNLKSRFDVNLDDVKKKENDFLQEIDALQYAIRDSLSNDQHLLKEGSPLFSEVSKINQYMSEIQSAWAEKMAQYSRGTDFRKKMGDSFLVYVYGKVNAGKSSLGNYIATGMAKPTEEDLLQVVPRVQYGIEQESEAKGFCDTKVESGFSVNREECTSSIQYFQLPGLTWVDSPGLHSKTFENGDLARKYAMSADLVLYVMNSCNPATKSDMDELKELLKLNKPVILVITRSDEIEQDEVNGEIVNTLKMKSFQARQAQADYVISSIREHIGNNTSLENVEAITLSIRYAEEATDDLELKESGVSNLMMRLSELINKSSVQIKIDTPNNNLKDFIIKVISELAEVEGAFKGFDSQLKSQKEDILLTSKHLKTELKAAIFPEVKRFVDDLGRDKCSYDAIKSVMELNVKSAIESAIKKDIATTKEGFKNIIDQEVSFDVPDYKKEYSEFAYSSNGNHNKSIGALIGATAGGLIGLIGGPAGVALGSSIAGLAGGFVGSLIESEKMGRVYAGDNKHEIERSLVSYFSKYIDELVELNYNHPMIGMIEALERSTQDSLVKMNHLKRWAA